MKEVCSCGASVEDATEAEVVGWRANHRHEMPIIINREHVLPPIYPRPRPGIGDPWLPTRRPPMRFRAS